MFTKGAAQVRSLCGKIPEEMKAILEEGALMILILLVASAVHNVATLCFRHEAPPIIEGLLLVSLGVLATIYGIAVMCVVVRLGVHKRRVALGGEREEPHDERESATGADLDVDDEAADAPPRSHERLSVLVADDDHLSARTIRDILEADERFGSVAEAHTPDMALWEVEQRADNDPFDVVLLDVGFEKDRRSGIDLLAPLRDRSPASKLVMMSVSRDPQTVLAALSNGAHGFLWKNESRADFAEAIVDAARDNFVLSASIARAAFDPAA